MNESESKRGFASLTPERRREIAAMGGKAVPAKKRTFSRKRALAREAGRKGGQSVPACKRTFAIDHRAAAAAGAKGGKAVVSAKRAFAQDRALAARAGREGWRCRKRSAGQRDADAVSPQIGTSVEPS